MGHPAPGIAKRDKGRHHEQEARSPRAPRRFGGDVDSVLLGGGVAALGDRMLGPVVTELGASAAASPFLRSLRLPERVDLLPPGSPAAVLGAAIVGADTNAQEAVVHG